MKKYGFLLLALCMVNRLLAIPASPYIIDYKQPDGSIMQVLLRGDELGHYYETADGQTLQLDAEGYLQPTSVQQAAQIRKAASSMQRTPANLAATGYPTTGSPKALVILVNFTDCAFSSATAKSDFQALLNQQNYSANGGTGSAADYFKTCSNGQFSPNFNVVGPYTLPNNIAYYGANSSGQDLRPAYMIVDACAAANADVNFSDYDTDGDGIIDNVFVYYAGYNEAEGAPANTVWPHRWTVYPTGMYGTSGNYQGSADDATFDGKRVYNYACTSELRGNSGTSMCGIGTFCHEFGHVIGLNDYYHTTNSARQTLGKWDIMDSGSYLNNGCTPPIYCAYNRFFLGWIIPSQISTPEYMAIRPISQDSTHVPIATQAYLIAASTHNLNGQTPIQPEFFLLEYRKRVGWDAYLPGEGLCVWHIDYLPSAWKENSVNNYTGISQTYASHMRVYLQHNNGYNTANTGNAFYTGQSYTPTLWNGTALDRVVSDINVTDTMLYFTFMGGSQTDMTPPVADSVNNITMSCFTAYWTDGRSQHAKDSLPAAYELTAYYIEQNDTVFAANNLRIDSDHYTLPDLHANRNYTWFVNTLLNISGTAVRTRPSNIIMTTTLADHDSRKLPAEIIINNQGTQLQIVKANANEPLYIYTIDGRLVLKDDTHQNIVYFDINDFAHGSVLIFQQGKRTVKWMH